MFNYVVDAKYIKDYKILIAFNNGKKGEIDLAEKLKNKGGVFEALKDISSFKDFKVTNDTLSWKNGADLAPESLYELFNQQNIKKTLPQK